ncbi:MAG: DUF502 domain-containing protein [Pirellulaceae bacterium]|nr:DUF502 domain-containing protein [Pirellulaceae bacterium]
MSSPAPQPGFSQRLGRPLITGLLCFLPAALTLAVISWVVVFLHDLVGPSSPFGRIMVSVGLNFVTCEVIAWSVGVLGTLVAIYGLGALIESGAGNRYQRFMEGALNRVPLVNTIYDASKQLTSLFDRKKDTVQAMTPVLCTFGADGGAATLGLLPSPRPIRIGDRDYYVVLIPTAPVPFGGALLCLPVEHVRPAGCSFDGMVNVFMSMGVSAPDHLGSPPSAAAEAEETGRE